MTHDAPRTEQSPPRVGMRRRGTLILVLVVLAIAVALIVLRPAGSGDRQEVRTSPQPTIITPPTTRGPPPPAGAPERP